MTTTQPEPLIVADPEILSTDYFTKESMFRKDKKGLPVPSFTVNEVGKFFFAKKADWMRWRVREGFFILGGDLNHEHDFDEAGKCECGAEELGRRRSDSGFRIYSLADVERMAHALAQRGAIQGADLANVIILVKTSAKVYGYIA